MITTLEFRINGHDGLIFFGSCYMFWTIGSIVSKLSGNVKYIIIYDVKFKNPDSTLPGAGGGAFLVNFEYFFSVKFGKPRSLFSRIDLQPG